jgi:hypothetical protein
LHSASSEFDLPGNISRAIARLSVTRPTAAAMPGLPMRRSSSLRKPTSKAALWITISAPLRKVSRSSATVANSGLSARNSSVRPWIFTASSLLRRSGFR